MHTTQVQTVGLITCDNIFQTDNCLRLEDLGRNRNMSDNAATQQSNKQTWQQRTITNMQTCATNTNNST